VSKRRAPDRAETGRSELGSDPFAAAMRATLVPMLITDPNQPDNPIVFANDAFCELTGYARDEIIGRNCRFLQGPETSRTAAAEIRDAVAERVAIEIEILNNKKNGDRFWNRLSISPLFDDDAKLTYFFASLSDLTADRSAEQRLDALIRSSSEARWSLNADWSELTQMAGGNFIPDTKKDKNWLVDYIPLADRDAVRNEYERAVRTKSTYFLEHRVNRADGTLGWANARAVPLLDPQGAVTGWFGAASDITNRKLAEMALRESEERLLELNETLERRVDQAVKETDAGREALLLHENIVQSYESPVVAFDRGYRLIAFNKAHSDAFHHVFDHRPAIGECLLDLFPANQKAVLRSAMDRALGGESFTMVEEYGDPGIAKTIFEVSYFPLRDEAGQITAGFHLAKDISARKHAEAELAMVQETLRQSQKLEAMGQLTGGVAHDFNNLLTVIRSASDLLKRPDVTEERRIRYIGAISETVDRAAKLTSQLLAFARRQTLKPAVFNAAQGVRDLVGMMSTLIGVRASVNLQLAQIACFVSADPSQFDTALINLAVNARDAMGGHGQITIGVGSVETIPAVRLHPAREGKFVAISVSDKGSGIIHDDLDRIFEPFFTTKSAAEGTGLGLSQVFGFAKQSGGEVTVESRPGEGATFTLYLPHVAQPELAAESPEPEALVDGHDSCVLVVEDNVTVGTFATQTLAELGYRTVWAANAEEALAELAKDAGRFDIVFSDVVMTGMNGAEMAQRIRSDYPEMPVVLTSGYSHVLAQHGTYGFELLHKPYSVEQLSRMLRKVAKRDGGDRAVTAP